MRVLVIGKYYPPAPGGVETVTRDLCTELGSHGVESMVLAHTFDAHEMREESHGPVTIRRAKTALRLLYAPIAPGFPALLRRSIREFRPDVVHIHMPNLTAFLALPLVRGIPIVLHWHSDVIFPRRQWMHRLAYLGYGRLESMLLRRARRIVCTSPPYAEASPVLLPHRDKCRVVPIGISQEPPSLNVSESVLRERYSLHGPIVFAVGRFAHYKGFDILVKAFAEMPDGVPGTLVIAGDGEERNAVSALVEQCGFRDRIQLPGRISDDDLQTFMHTADIFCLPSVERTEAFGVTILEAMRCGTPVISTSIPGSGTGWVNRHEESGLVVPPDDIPALSRALSGLLTDENRRRALGEGAKARFRENFTLRASGEAMLGVLREAIR